MKNIFLLIIFSTRLCSSFSQDTIKGLWYSEDSSRIYKIFLKKEGFEGIVLESKRKSDKPGELILKDLIYNRRTKAYKGYIRAVSDGMTVSVKIRLDDDGQGLRLKLKRMLFFPVRLRWPRHT